jgi:hypothetical protein
VSASTLLEVPGGEGQFRVSWFKKKRRAWRSQRRWRAWEAEIDAELEHEAAAELAVMGSEASRGLRRREGCAGAI